LYESNKYKLNALFKIFDINNSDYIEPEEFSFIVIFKLSIR